MRISQVPDLTALKDKLYAKRIALANSLFGLVLLYYLLKLAVCILPANPVKLDDDLISAKTQLIKPVPNVSNLHIFGIYQMNDSSILQIAQLGLTLQGVLYDTQPASSQAIISSASGTAKAYKVGDMINGVTIKEIMPNDVILQIGENLQRLPLIRPTLNFGTTP